MAETSTLMFRGETRHEVAVSVWIRVAGPHQNAVRVRGAAHGSAGAIDGLMLDISASGAGVVSSLLVPKMTRVDVAIDLSSCANPAISLADGELRLPCRVMRVAMTDRRPAYLLGLAFDTDRIEPGVRASIQHLLDGLDGVEAA